MHEPQKNVYDVHGFHPVVLSKHPSVSPNCCAVTIFEYSITEVTLPSCLSVQSKHFASRSKSQSADLDLLKLAKKRKSVWPALFRGNVCI